MRVNPTTLLFEDLSPAEREELLEWAQRIVLTGAFPPVDPPWLAEWLRVTSLDDDRQRLLVLSTAVPQRVLLSVALSLTRATKSYSDCPERENDARYLARKLSSSTLLIVGLKEICLAEQPPVASDLSKPQQNLLEFKLITSNEGCLSPTPTGDRVLAVLFESYRLVVPDGDLTHWRKFEARLGKPVYEASDDEILAARAAVQPGLDGEELSQRDVEARALASVLDVNCITDLTRACTAAFSKLPVELRFAGPLQAQGLVKFTDENSCVPTPWGRRVYSWLGILGKLPLEPEVTLERVSAILEKAGHPLGSGSTQRSHDLFERARNFAIDWFTHFGLSTPPEDVELIRRAASHFNTHRRWPWEPTP